MTGYWGQFGTAMRSIELDLTVAGWFEGRKPKTIFISQGMKDRFGLEDGDTVYVSSTCKITAARVVGRDIEMREAYLDPALGAFLGLEKGAPVTIGLTTRRCLVARRVDVDFFLHEGNNNVKTWRDQFMNHYSDDVPLMHGDIVLVKHPNMREIIVARIRGNPNGPVRVGKTTAIKWHETRALEPPLLVKNTQGRITRTLLEGFTPDLYATNQGWDSIGGMDEVITQVRSLVEFPLLHPEVGLHYGKQVVRGVLLSGPPGCGKTMIGRAIANEIKASFHVVSVADIMSKYVGEAENQVKQLFKDARDNAPSIIFLDEVDSIITRNEYKGAEDRVVSQFLIEMDGFSRRDKIIVIGATNNPDIIPGEFRRPGRFDEEIVVKAPDMGGRTQILRIHLAELPHVLDEQDAKALKRTMSKLHGKARAESLVATPVDIDAIARATHGFTGADLSGLVKSAVTANLERMKPALPRNTARIPLAHMDLLQLCMEDFEVALRAARPSALRAMTRLPAPVHWSAVGGLDHAKRELERAVCWQFTRAEQVARMGVRLPKGVVLHGPPGTGKTLLAKAAAWESGCNFIPVSGPELLSKWHGESEALVRKTFKEARQSAPCILFFDEIDALAPPRGKDPGSHMDGVVAQLLSEMDGIRANDGVVIIATTNRIELVDPAFLRNGRIDRHIFIDLPDEDSREKILAVHFRGKAVDSSVDLNVLVKELAHLTPGLSGANLEALIMNVGIVALERGKTAMSMDDFYPVIDSLKERLVHIEAMIHEEMERELEEEEENHMMAIERDRRKRLASSQWEGVYI